MPGEPLLWSYFVWVIWHLRPIGTVTKNAHPPPVPCVIHCRHIRTAVLSSPLDLSLLSRNPTCRHTATVHHTGTPLDPSILSVRTVTCNLMWKDKRNMIKLATHFFCLHSGPWLRRKASYKKNYKEKVICTKGVLERESVLPQTCSRFMDEMMMMMMFGRGGTWSADDPY